MTVAAMKDQAPLAGDGRCPTRGPLLVARGRPGAGVRQGRPLAVRARRCSRRCAPPTRSIAAGRRRCRRRGPDAERVVSIDVPITVQEPSPVIDVAFGEHHEEAIARERARTREVIEGLSSISV